MKNTYKRGDILTGRNGTINLALQHEVEREEKMIKLWYMKPLSYKDKILMEYSKLIITLATIWAIFILLLVAWLRYEAVNAEGTEDKIDRIYNEFSYYKVDNTRDYERKLRLEVCTRVYEENKEFVDNTYIHPSQDPIIRCATMMWLIWAYESGFYTSRRYTEDNNAFWIKDYNTWRFKIYRSTYEGKIDFAEKYLVWRGNNSFRGHKNRTIEQFVRNWSTTDQDIYIQFIEDRYFNMFKELQLLNK